MRSVRGVSGWLGRVGYSRYVGAFLLLSSLMLPIVNGDSEVGVLVEGLWSVPHNQFVLDGILETSIESVDEGLVVRPASLSCELLELGGIMRG